MSKATVSTDSGVVRNALRRVMTGGVLLYPLVMHYLIVYDMIGAALAGLAIVSSTTALLHLFEKRGWLYALPYALVALAALTGLGSDTVHALFLPPIAFNLIFAYFFGRTLRRGETPLIERFMTLHHPGDMSDEVVRFARHLTYVWTIFLIAMAATGVVLALYAPLETWSTFANVINYVLVLVLFIGQFVYGYARYRMIHFADIVPVAMRVVRRAARSASLGK